MLRKVLEATSLLRDGNAASEFSRASTTPYVHWVHTCSGDSELETEQDSAKALAGERVGMTIARLRL